ncbi:GntR family transcriptional regulator [Mesorhizobium xinjiangense]|uniref:GntR family transcriptional regulator n=1 Tax=Mesorhizobium xinjiangense TaxID=2678685 RepID=UPI0012ED092C|nr:GntR family transcriptional regulator [Mesorhizobium xinjiangense]
MSAGARLQRDLVSGIWRLVHEDGLRPGDRIVESRLAERLRVSRTPVRAAIDALAAEGYIERLKNRGVRLLHKPAEDAASDTVHERDELLQQISQDRNLQRLPDDVTETQIMRRYDLSRIEANRILERLSALGVLERKLGYGWRFLDSLQDLKARAEAYAFRIVVEPAALLQPGFALPKPWAVNMRRRHEHVLASEWSYGSSIGFFEMNAEFHAGLAEASGNRYFADVVRRQNQLRRLINYQWRHGRERVETNCREHLEILKKLEDGDNEMAALLLRQHIMNASNLPTPFGDGNPDHSAK